MGSRRRKPTDLVPPPRHRSVRAKRTYPRTRTCATGPCGASAPGPDNHVRHHQRCHKRHRAISPRMPKHGHETLAESGVKKARIRDVRFTSKSRHPPHRHQCLQSAISRHSARTCSFEKPTTSKVFPCDTPPRHLARSLGQSAAGTEQVSVRLRRQTGRCVGRSHPSQGDKPCLGFIPRPH